MLVSALLLTSVVIAICFLSETFICLLNYVIAKFNSIFIFIDVVQFYTLSNMQKLYSYWTLCTLIRWSCLLCFTTLAHLVINYTKKSFKNKSYLVIKSHSNSHSHSHSILLLINIILSLSCIFLNFDKASASREMEFFPFKRIFSVHEIFFHPTCLRMSAFLIWFQDKIRIYF